MKTRTFITLTIALALALVLIMGMIGEVVGATPDEGNPFETHCTEDSDDCFWNCRTMGNQVCGDPLGTA